MNDYTITADEDGRNMVAHRADCPLVRLLADAGKPVLTMWGCEREPPDDIPRHDCFEDRS